MIDGIALANNRQSVALVDVAAAIRQMDEMTQHNAALVEETNAAIEQTEGQARQLDRMVDLFGLTTTGGTEDVTTEISTSQALSVGHARKDRMKKSGAL